MDGGRMVKTACVASGNTLRLMVTSSAEAVAVDGRGVFIATPWQASRMRLVKMERWLP